MSTQDKISLLVINWFWCFTFLANKIKAMRYNQNPNVRGRKFNGSPHLKLKKVKQFPRQKIRRALRDFIPLERFKQQQKTS
ncbi:hypothetical protein DBR43_10020 [Pedobacter sp. KBW06]|nr:hypothetical protein DBR43_10020 [Pedobacter sp. KBW06]